MGESSVSNAVFTYSKRSCEKMMRRVGSIGGPTVGTHALTPKSSWGVPQSIRSKVDEYFYGKHELRSGN